MESFSGRKEVPAAEALKAKNIKPLIPEGKDALGILSNSSVAMALTMDAAKAMGQILKVSPIVYGISLEGLNGNVAPFLSQTTAFHPFPDCRKRLKNCVKCSPVLISGRKIRAEDCRIL